MMIYGTRSNKIIDFVFLLCLFWNCFVFGQSNERKIESFLLGGDLCFGETYQNRLEEKGKTNVLKAFGYDYGLAGIAPLLYKPDLVIANLETPLTDILNSPFSEDQKYKIHKGDIIQNPMVLNKYNIKVVSLANNHAMDYGSEGLKQTFQILSDNSIHYFGAGLNEKEASEPYRFYCQSGHNKLQIIIIGGLDYKKKYDEEYRFYADSNSVGINALTKDRIIAEIDEVRAKNNDAFIIVYPHWLENYVWRTEDQIVLAHTIIDAGADLMVGHGTHMFQEVERYKNKWILYSIGNLMFNSPGRYQKKEANPYSFAGLFESRSRGKQVSMKIKLYFILSDNLKTNYQPRFLSKVEMFEALGLFKSHCINVNHQRDYVVGRDKIGYYIALKTGQLNK
ncbi:MAG: CapA family protein [Saprospiraceae bacterium]